MRISPRRAAPAAAGGFAQVHLQWFAAPGDERTEPPGALRRRAAREAGMVARSAELPAALALLGGVAALALLGASLWDAAGAVLRQFLAAAGSPERAAHAPGSAAGTAAGAALGHVLRLAWPVAAFGLAAAAGGILAQGGVRLAPRALLPDASRVVPRWNRFARRACSVEAAFNLVKELLKVALIGAVAVAAVGAVLDRLPGAPLAAGGAVLARAALRGGGLTGAALLALALLDYSFRRYRLHLRLRVAPRELREERRRQEGDPAVRARLRARMRELLGRTVGAQVAAADVVIAHGRRRAVALRWDAAAMPAPVVVAKGAADGARRIRALAAVNGVAVVERPPLAAALWNAAAVGDPIPAACYGPTAAILAELQRRGAGGAP